MSLARADVAVLDNPVWHALTGPDRHHAERYGEAVRYQPDVSVFHALPQDPDLRAWSDLAALVGPDAEVLVNGPVLEPPGDWTVVAAVPGVQLVAERLQTAPDDETVALTHDDVPEMLDLVARTQPGPFRPGTIELGGYLGIRREGRLVAMAGERFHPPGWAEISAVCTDPAWRGHGLASRLVRATAHAVVQRGDGVLLHAAETNVHAIRLYEQLGFVLRRQVAFALLRSPRLTPTREDSA